MAKHGQSITPPWALNLARWIVTRPWLFVCLGVVTGLLFLFPATRLTIDQQLRTLLPADHPSIVRLDHVQSRLGNQSDLYVVVESPSREANIQFADQLAQELEKRDDIRFVLFYKDAQFFRKHALLYAELSELLELRRQVMKRLQATVRRQMALFPEELAQENDSTFDVEDLRKQYGVDQAFPEYFEANEGRLLLIKARPTIANTDIEHSRRLIKEVHELIEMLRPGTFHEQMKVSLQGSYAEHSQRAQTLQSDVMSGSLVVLGLLFLIVGVYFRSFWAMFLVMVPLLISAIVALGCAQLIFTELNLVSAFIFAVQLGLGIDYSIHFLARLQQERMRGHELEQALAITLSTTGISTAAGAASTGLSFALLYLSDFQGFAQFGLIAAIGILVAFLSATIFMPALLVGFKLGPIRQTRRLQKSDSQTSTPHVPSKQAVPWASFLLLAIIFCMSAVAAKNSQHLSFEYDLSQLDQGSKRERQVQRKEEQGYRNAAGAVTTTAPAVIWSEHVEETKTAVQQLNAMLELNAEQVAQLTGLLPLRPNDEVEQPGQLRRKKQPKVAEQASKDEGRDEDEELEPEDPIFVALQTQAEQSQKLSDETRGLLLRYAPEQLRAMDDRLIAALSIFSFVPDLQAEKLKVIRDIRRQIDRKRGLLSKQEKEQLAEWEPYLEVDQAITMVDLPSWVKVQFTDQDGQIGRFALFWTRGRKADYHDSKAVYDAFFTLQGKSQNVDVAAEFFVLPSVIDTLHHDGPWVMGAVFLVMIFTSIVLFRRFIGVAIVLVIVIVSLLALAGVMLMMGWKLNLFNIVALPLLIGMAQDNALHLFHRYTDEGEGGWGLAFRETGSAMFLTTLTTVIGFGSMLFVDHQGLFSLGVTAVIGMSLSLVVTVVIMPAFIHIIEWVRN